MSDRGTDLFVLFDDGCVCIAWDQETEHHPHIICSVMGWLKGSKEPSQAVKFADQWDHFCGLTEIHLMRARVRSHSLELIIGPQLTPHIHVLTNTDNNQE